MNLLRFLMLLSLAIWLGALIFFPFVAQTAFSSLPSHSAGIIVRSSLIKLDSIALASGIVFLPVSLTYNRIVLARARVLSTSHFLIIVMITLTAFSQFRIIPQMDTLRLSVVDISTLSSTDPIRTQFDSLHAWSTRMEGTVLVLALVVLYFTSRRLANPR